MHRFRTFFTASRSQCDIRYCKNCIKISKEGFRLSGCKDAKFLFLFFPLGVPPCMLFLVPVYMQVAWLTGFLFDRLVWTLSIMKITQCFDNMHVLFDILLWFQSCKLKDGAFCLILVWLTHRATPL